MQLFLASILSSAALLVCILAHSDWKPYSSTEDSSVAMSADSRTDQLLADMPHSRQYYDFASVSDGYPNEFPMRDHRDGESRPTKTLERTSDVAIHRKERTRVAEPSGLLARHDGHSLTFKDSVGRTVKMQLDFDEHSFELLADGISKEKLAKVKKVFSILKVSELAERELRKEFARAHRVEHNERRSAQRELQGELIRVGPVRAEPVEVKREQGECLCSDRPDKIDRTNP